LSALTKILIVLQLVFSLVLSVVLVLMVSKMEPYKTKVDSANAGLFAAVAEKVKLQEELSAANAAATAAADHATSEATGRASERARYASDSSAADLKRMNLESQVAQLQTQLAGLTASNKSLADANAEKDKRLADLSPQVSKLTQQNAALYQSNQESQNQLRAAEQALRKLQEVQAAGGGGGAAGGTATGSDSQVVALSATNQMHAPINSKISNIAQSAGRTLIELPMGTRDGVQQGTKLMIYRSTGYVGEAVVTRVTPDSSVAQVTSTKQGETVRGDEMVSTDK